eukprot:5411290-Amphidinium_carterae.1
MQLPSPRRKSSPAAAAQAFLAAELLPSPQATETAQLEDQPVTLLPAASPAVDGAKQPTTDAKSMEEWLQEAKKMVAALTPKSAEAAAPGPDCPGQLDAEGTTGS